MATILLITEEQRLRRLFAPLEAKRLFRLRVAATLAQAEEECAVRPPNFVFADCSSGLAPAALVKYLRTIAGEGAEVVLFCAAGPDAAATPAASEYRLLNPALDDQSLQQALLRIIPATPAPEALQPTELPPAQPGSARELLFSKPAPRSRFTVNWFFWSIPPALVLLCVWVFALSKDKNPALAPATQAVLAPRPAAAPVTLPVPETANRPATATVRKPSAATGAIPRRPAATQPVAPQSAAPQPVEPAAEPAAEPATAPAGEPNSYLVQRNDALLKVMMKKYGYSYQEALALIPELRRLNKGVDLNKLRPGQLLNIPPRTNVEGATQ